MLDASKFYPVNWKKTRTKFPWSNLDQSLSYSLDKGKRDRKKY